MTPGLEKKFLWYAAGLAGSLLAFLGHSVWERADATEAKVNRLEVRQEDAAEMLHEVRGDVKEILRQVNRMEGSHDVSRAP